MARLTAEQTALLLELMRQRREEEAGRTTTRYRISSATLRRISGRLRLRDTFLDELTDAMAELGWVIIPLGDNFGVLNGGAVEAWPRIASRRIRRELQRAHDPSDNGFFPALEAQLAVEQETADEED